MSKITLSSFAKIVKARRRQFDLTQAEVARRLNTSLPYFWLVEAGKRYPSNQLITKLAEALDLDRRELFFLANPTAKAILAQGPRPASRSPWDSFSRDERTRQLHNITDKEMEILSQVALMGEVRSASDFLFILSTIRHALKA